MPDIVAHDWLTQDVVDAAHRREQILGEEAGWILVHGLVGPTGAPGTSRCTCKAGASCKRAGKHPVASLFPNGSRDAVSLSGALERMDRGMRLAGVLTWGPGRERVLDADTSAGMSFLARIGDEVDATWLFVRTPRGMHLWQSGVAPVGHRDPNLARLSSATPRARRHIDVKTSGYVVWPDGRERWIMTRDQVVADLSGRFGGVVGIRRGIVDQMRSAAPDPHTEVGGSAGLGPSGDPVDLHTDMLRLVRESGDGERNDTLNFAAWRCRALVAYADWPEREVAESLYRAGRAAGLEHGETVRTVRSGLGITGSGGWTR